MNLGKLELSTSEVRQCEMVEEELGLSLLGLPPEILFKIFEYCDIKTLCRLSCVNRSFSYLLSDQFVWENKSRKCLASNQLDKAIYLRSCRRLEPKEKCRISCHWRNGDCLMKPLLLSRKVKYMPWLCLTSSILWVSRGGELLGFKHSRTGYLRSQPVCVLTSYPDDISRFVCREQYIVAGSMGKSLYVWHAHTGQNLLCLRDSHSSDIQDVDLSENLILSGSRDEIAKIWLIRHDNLELQYSLPCQDRVLSVALEPEGLVGAIGTSRHNQQSPPLRILDIETRAVCLYMGHDHRKGAGILNMQWESGHTLLTGGYDTYIRLWDTRTGECEMEWEDPDDLAIYCISSDRALTILSGANRHGLVRLWDKRLKRSVQRFYIPSRHGSPVYSLCFDACHLYAALDCSINLLEFHKG